ncbi:hypothetical protein ACHAXA_000225 [Cyclostephanos tholiformis]|uniref:Uncharacterized protein n=1 Tax=Cyclostephanos tholiformis TaxID=382380 RepID=A0ABD3REB2_9STRA
MSHWMDNITTDLHGLLSPQTIEDWGIVCRHVQRHPQQARERYYRHESPLQLALTARGDSNERMDALRALVDADPASIHSRDEEGRTALHTACAAGRSVDILRWLIDTEELLLFRNLPDCNECEQRSVTLRTDFPGGALPLHLIAACSAFDCTCHISSVKGENTDQYHRYHVHCVTRPDIISAYLSTTCIWQAYPDAVWERNCEGEIPLHAAASWGNVGAILSLLIATAVGENNCSGTASSAARRAALMTDDRNKTPLDRACNRLSSMCYNRQDERPRLDHSSFRRSFPREDPFAIPFDIISNEGRKSILGNKQMTSSFRRRIPGRGSSFRSSFSSSLLGGSSTTLGLRAEGDRWVDSSFIYFRNPIDPTLGIESLDGDGDEELAKIELLAKAAYGCFEVYSETTFTSTSPTLPADTTTTTTGKISSCFQLLHAVIVLGCAPEIVWHAAATYPHQVEEIDDLGRCPLFLACNRLAECTRLANQHRRIFDAKEIDEATENVDVVGSKDMDSGTKLVRSLLLGENYPSVLNDAMRSTTERPSTQRPTRPNRQTKTAMSSMAESGNVSFPLSTRDDDLRECASLSREIIDIMLRSSLFGKPEMASVPDAKGRLPLHVLLEAGMQWVGEPVLNCDSNGENDVGDSLLLQSLMDVYPRALEIKDGETGLLPFMIAATPKSPKESNETGNEGCTRQTQTIYWLLLKAPNAIALSMV